MCNSFTHFVRRLVSFLMCVVLVIGCLVGSASALVDSNYSRVRVSGTQFGLYVDSESSFVYYGSLGALSAVPIEFEGSYAYANAPSYALGKLVDSYFFAESWAIGLPTQIWYDTSTSSSVYVSEGTYVVDLAFRFCLSGSSTSGYNTFSWAFADLDLSDYYVFRCSDSSGNIVDLPVTVSASVVQESGGSDGGLAVADVSYSAIISVPHDEFYYFVGFLGSRSELANLPFLWFSDFSSALPVSSRRVDFQILLYETDFYAVDLTDYYFSNLFDALAEILEAIKAIKIESGGSTASDYTIVLAAISNKLTWLEAIYNQWDSYIKELDDISDSSEKAVELLTQILQALSDSGLSESIDYSDILQEIYDLIDEFGSGSMAYYEVFSRILTSIYEIIYNETNSILRDILASLGSSGTLATFLTKLSLQLGDIVTYLGDLNLDIDLDLSKTNSSIENLSALLHDDLSKVEYYLAFLQDYTFTLDAILGDELDMLWDIYRALTDYGDNTLYSLGELFNSNLLIGDKLDLIFSLLDSFLGSDSDDFDDSLLTGVDIGDGSLRDLVFGLVDGGFTLIDFMLISGGDKAISSLPDTVEDLISIADGSASGWSIPGSGAPALPAAAGDEIDYSEVWAWGF